MLPLFYHRTYNIPRCSVFSFVLVLEGALKHPDADSLTLSVTPSDMSQAAYLYRISCFGCKTGPTNRSSCDPVEFIAGIIILFRIIFQLSNKKYFILHSDLTISHTRVIPNICRSFGESLFTTDYSLGHFLGVLQFFKKINI